MSQFVYSFMEPILAKTLEELSLTQVDIGWFFIILPAAYIPAAISINYMPKIDKKKLIMVGMVFCGVALLFVGPSSVLAFNEKSKLRIMIVGQGLLGLFIPVGLILALPTMVEVAN